MLKELVEKELAAERKKPLTREEMGELIALKIITEAVEGEIRSIKTASDELRLEAWGLTSEDWGEIAPMLEKYLNNLHSRMSYLLGKSRRK